MVNKEELLKERYLLLKDKEDLEKSAKGLYFLYNHGSSTFCSLSSPEFHKESIYRAIEIRVKEIDKILNI